MHTRLSAGDLEFNETAATAVFRIVQEALTNVAKHAQATEVTVTVERSDSQCIVSIEDDGNGTSPQARAKPDSFGLRGIRERVRQLNGTVSVGNGTHSGFSVRTTFPLDSVIHR
ncbi:sensor histidine kinase [Paraburkholderia guartelaensis]|uniref:sensor histidine kinase n=1 Tax=Paraburkholderia guartelaensis TaxID=2546446 RepID=UPI002AB7343C|nr:ATP-binding protein [Paraburkholderia guartelaensis]